MSVPVISVTIEAYRSNIGTFFKFQNHGYYLIKVNGQKIESIPKYNGWFKVPGEIETVESIIPPKQVQVGWELISSDLIRSLPDDAIPSELSMEDLYSFWDDDEERTIFEGKYASLAALYKEKWSMSDETLAPVNLKIIELGNLNISNFEEPQKLVVSVQNDGGWSTKKTVVNLRDIVTIDQITKMLTPEFLLDDAPCELSSHQMYKIVRAFVKDNIDPKQAQITSDYDFCFTVKKKVAQAPIRSRVEQLTASTRSSQPKKYRENLIEYTLVNIFEMTYAGYKGTGGYDGYTCISPLKSDSLKSLYEKLQEYLDDLITLINSQVKKCDHCNGYGVHVHSMKTNEGLE